MKTEMKKYDLNFNDVYLVLIDKATYKLYVVENRIYNEKEGTMIYTLLDTFNGETREVTNADVYNEDLFERKCVNKFAIENYG